jgi:hypothetical protein
MSDYFEDDELDEAEAFEGAAAAVQHALGAGASIDAIQGTEARLLAAGLDPITAAGAAADLHDHSEAADEFDALRKIAAREGWS